MDTIGQNDTSGEIDTKDIFKNIIRDVLSKQDKMNIKSIIILQRCWMPYDIAPKLKYLMAYFGENILEHVLILCTFSADYSQEKRLEYKNIVE